MVSLVAAEGAVNVFLREMELKSTVLCDCCDRMKKLGVKVRLFEKKK